MLELYQHREYCEASELKELQQFWAVLTVSYPGRVGGLVFQHCCSCELVRQRLTTAAEYFLLPHIPYQGSPTVSISPKRCISWEEQMSSITVFGPSIIVFWSNVGWYTLPCTGYILVHFGWFHPLKVGVCLAMNPLKKHYFVEQNNVF